jgi:HEAT repeat protein
MRRSCRDWLLTIFLLALLIQPARSSAQEPETPDSQPASRPAPKDAKYREKSVAEWIEVLESSEVDTVRRAIVCLGDYGPEAASAAPRLVRFFTDERAALIEDAVVSLASIGADAVPAILDLLKRKKKRASAEARQSALMCLFTMGPKAAAASEDLTALLKSERDESLRGMAARALGASAQRPEHLLALAAALEDKAASVRRNAALALADRGAEAVPAVPALCRMLQATEASDRKLAAEALGKIGPAAERGTSALIAALDDSDWLVALNAADALGSIGPKAAAAIAALERLKRSDKPALRMGAEDALKRIRNER